MSLFKGNLDSSNKFTANDDIRGLKLISVDLIPSYMVYETGAATPVEYFYWTDDSGNYRQHTSAPTAANYNTAGGVIAGASNAGASKALDNIASAAINADLLPGSDNAIDLGDATHVYAESFVTKTVFYPTDCYITGTSAVATLTGSLVTGSDGEGYDTIFYGETADQYLHWDENFASDMGGLILRDNVFLVFGDASTGDVTFEWNEATFEMDAPTDSTWNIGATKQFDVVFHGQTGGQDVMFDQSADAMVALDNAAFIVGTTNYIKIAADGTDVHIDGNAANKSVAWGASNALDLVLHGAGANRDYFWDASENTMFVLDNAIFSVGTGGDFNLVSTGTVTTGTFSGTTSGLILQSYADQTTGILKLDGATNDWDGADDVGMLWLTNDVAHVDAGAASLLIADSSTPINAAQGFMARFVHSGTKKASSWGVAIEVPAQQGAFWTNGIVTIVGQDDPGEALVQITGNDTSGDDTTVDIHTAGSGAGLLITSDDVDSLQLNLLAKANQTASMAIIDGQSVDWIGNADDVGMVSIIQGTTALAHVGSTLLYVASDSQSKASAEGTLARFLSTGAAQAGAAAVEISANAANDALHVSSGIAKFSGTLEAAAAFSVGTTSTFTGAATFTAGQQSSAVARTAGDGTGTALIADGTTYVTITAGGDANSWVTLPTPTPGNVVWMYIGATGCELRSSDPATIAINGGSEADAESALPANTLHRAICTSATTWVLTKFVANGTESAGEVAAAAA